jgi:hypothetical protein
MTGPGTVLSGARTPRAGAMDQWIGRAAAATVAGLAGIAGAISYSHMRQLAQGHGQTGWHAHAFPLSVDGIEIVASLVLLADRRAGRRSGWLPWAALAIGTAGSLAANVATAGQGTISRIIAGWPAVALLIAVKLLSGILSEHPAALAVDRSDAADDQDTGDRPWPAAVPIPGIARPSAAEVRPSSPGGPAVRIRNPAVGVPSGAPLITDLMPAARAARTSLHRDGHRLTRDTLAARLREDGYPVRNSRLTPLLQALRSESLTPPPTSTNAVA